MDPCPQYVALLDTDASLCLASQQTFNQVKDFGVAECPVQTSVTVADKGQEKVNPADLPLEAINPYNSYSFHLLHRQGLSPHSQMSTTWNCMLRTRSLETV